MKGYIFIISCFVLGMFFVLIGFDLNILILPSLLFIMTLGGISLGRSTLDVDRRHGQTQIVLAIGLLIGASFILFSDLHAWIPGL